MILAILLLLSGLTISAVAIYYSVMGLMAIFSAAAIPIAIMGISLEVGKLVTASWVKQYWQRLPLLMKSYAIVAVAILMVITSLGIFGFLSKAHSDQTLVSGDVQSKIAIYDEKIQTAKENIDADRKAIKQMDDAVDQVMGRSTSETGADKAVAIRRGQQKERARLAQDIEAEQKKINRLMEDRAPIAAEVRKVEAEVGPIKYIAAFVYGDNPDASILERAVTWVIVLIVIVFDPLAVVMLLAAQMTFQWIREEKSVKDDSTIYELDQLISKLPTEEEKAVEEEVPEETPADPPPPSDSTLDPCYKCGTPLIIAPGIGPFCPNKECSVADSTSGETIDFVFANPITPEVLPPKEKKLSEEPLTDIELSAMDDTLPSDINNIERSIDYVTTPESEPIAETTPKQAEAAPGLNRGVMHSHDITALKADNEVNLGTASSTNFGTEFSPNPSKGDIYLRVDYLPNRLFKFNGDKWIEIDSEQKDLYAYNELYIKYLINQIDSNSFNPDLLNDLEREQIQEYLSKHDV